MKIVFVSVLLGVLAASALSQQHNTTAHMGFSADTHMQQYHSTDGWLNVTLKIESLTFTLPSRGVSFQTRSYNGMFPGPALRVAPGDRVHITLVNALEGGEGHPNCSAPDSTFRAANASNLHIHGIFDSAVHDDTFACVNPGAAKEYSYTIDPRSGTSLLWYHPHFDGSSGMQLYGGMAGVFDIVDPVQEKKYGLDQFRNVTLLLQMLSFDPHTSEFIEKVMENGKPPTSTLPLNLKSPAELTGFLMLVNGGDAQEAEAACGETMRVRVVNAMSGSSNVLNLGFDDHRCGLKVIAYDGVFLTAPRSQSSVVLPAGGRAELLVSCAEQGSFHLSTSSENVDAFGQRLPPGHPALILHVIGSCADASLGLDGLVRLPGPPEYYPDLAGATPTGFNSILLSNAPGDNVLNGWPYDGTVSYTMPVRSVQQWTIAGGEGVGFEKQHPYHQHMTHFQVTAASVDTKGLMGMVGDYRDTVPMWRDLNYTIRFVPQFTGLMTIHCHVLKHEDLGMMTIVNVTAN